jgi:ribosome-associated protein
MLQVTPTLSIPCSELTFNFVRASGPGGQNVNKVATGVQLRFNVRATHSLGEEIKGRLEKLAGNKMTLDGELVIEAKRYRSQEQNKIDAKQRLVSILRKALDKPKRRRPTYPTAVSRVRRIEAKRRRGKTKSSRKLVDE